MEPLTKEQPINIFWFRRDLRLHDNHGLYRALTSGEPVLPVFIFDTAILDKLKNKEDPRVYFIHQEIAAIQQELQKHQTSLWVKYGTPVEAFKELITQFTIEQVFLNRDYEPYAHEREKAVMKVLDEHGIKIKGFKDQVIFEKNEVVKNDGSPYVVFTPYSKQWLTKFTGQAVENCPSEANMNNFVKTSPFQFPTLEEMGFKATQIPISSKYVEDSVLSDYHKTRNYPALNGTSRLSIHLRFGTISIRQLVKRATALNKTFLNELIWRDFYQMILWQFPRVVNESFKKAFDHIPWQNDEAEFEQWCKGNTGYPLVDAGMRQLNSIGYMHNRLRMVTASFLTKHLLVDWRWGEAYFAEKLLDYELASNNGGWQWAAGSGVDAAPYFRIFNPQRQTERFDPHYRFIKHWVPEYGTPAYPNPMVDHKYARERALDTYKQAV